MSASVSVSPLSPARACARSCSLRFTPFLHDRHLRSHTRALEQKRDDADALLRIAAHAAAARRPVDPQRFHFGADALGELAGGGARGDAQARLVGRLRMPEVGAMRAVDADELNAQVGYVLAQPFAHDLAGEPGARHGFGAGVGNLAFADEARAIADAYLVRGGTGTAARALDGD